MTYSFITEIYIASLKGYYSELLLTPAWLRGQFKVRIQRIGVDPGKQCSAMGSPFQTEGPTNDKVQFCLVDVRQCVKKQKKFDISKQIADHELPLPMVAVEFAFVRQKLIIMLSLASISRTALQRVYFCM